MAGYRQCRAPGCLRMVQGDPWCPRHAHLGAALRWNPTQKNPEHYAVYRQAAWRALAARVVAEQPVCACGRRSEMADHVVPIADGGDPWDGANLQAMCRRCHARKHRSCQELYQNGTVGAVFGCPTQAPDLRLLGSHTRAMSQSKTHVGR